MSEVVLTLGNFKFQNYEIPEKISVGGRQKLAIHELVGGIRTIDAMGGFTDAIKWSGLMTGADSVSRARQLDTMRSIGAPVDLTWSEYKFVVVVREFRADFERVFQIPYEITCEVVKSITDTPQTGAPNVDVQTRADMKTVSGLAALINNPTLTSLTGTLSGAISAVSDFSKAAQSTLNSVLQPLANVQAQVKSLIASASNTIANVTTLGGILPNNPIAKQAAALTSQVSAMTQLPQLYNLQSVLGRMGSNLSIAQNSGQSITTAGGNLLSLASKLYGDATAWPIIAAANKITDPQVTGIQTLTIPPAPSGPDQYGGILNG